MNLPITFGNVPYKVAGSSTYKGDLILTPEVVYYFPHTDVASKRYFVIAIVLLVLLAPLLAAASIFVIIVFVTLFIVLFIAAGFLTPQLLLPVTTSGVKNLLKFNEVTKEWKQRPDDPNEDGESDDEAESSEILLLSTLINFYPITLNPELWYSLILESAFLAMKDNKSLSPHSLPSPIRFPKRDISDISLSPTGLLTIKTAFDMNNEFHLGTQRKDQLKKGLMEVRLDFIATHEE